MVQIWQAIGYVSSGVTLVAFAVAALAWVLKARSDEREKLIYAAEPSQRADLVRNALEFFHVETSGLTRDQQFKVAIEQIRARSQRFRLLVFLVGFLAVVGTALAIYAISVSRNTEPRPGTSAETADESDGIRKDRNLDASKNQHQPVDSSFLTLPNRDCRVTSTCQQAFSVAFSPDNRLLAYGDRSGDIHLWSLQNVKEVNTLTGSKSPSDQLEFNSAGDLVLSRSLNGVFAWKVSTGVPYEVISSADGSISHGGWSASGKTIAATPMFGKVLVWTEGQSKAKEASYAFSCLAVSSNGKTIAYGKRDKQIAVSHAPWDKEIILIPALQSDPKEMMFSSSGERLVVGDQAGVLRSWSIVSGNLEFQVALPGGAPRAMAASSDESYLAVISLNGGVWLIDRNGNRLPRVRHQTL